MRQATLPTPQGQARSHWSAPIPLRPGAIWGRGKGLMRRVTGAPPSTAGQLGWAGTPPTLCAKPYPPGPQAVCPWARRCLPPPGLSFQAGPTQGAWKAVPDLCELWTDGL